MSTGKPPQKGPNILGVLTDFIVLVLLLGAAAGGGYYWGTIQRMAPVRAVAAGTPGALSADTSEVASVKGPSGKEKANNAAGSE